MKNKKTVIFVVTLVILLLAALTVSNTAFKSKTNSPGQNQVEEFVGFDLPDSARDTHFYVTSYMDTQSYIKFVANTNEINEFLKLIGFELPLTEEYGEFFITLDINRTIAEKEENSGWWDPHQQESLVGGSYEDFSLGRNYEAVVHQLSDTESVVYMIVGTTP